MKKIFAYILLLIGVLILIYPLIGKFISINNQTIAITKYEEIVKSIPKEEIIENKKKEEQYNEAIYKQDENTKSKIDFLKISDMLAIINIPKINVQLPIYEGTSNHVLENGIGHMENTSLPCGGRNTLSVLVGHSGFSKSILFDNLEKLQIGDKFYIKHLDKILEYEITQKNIVLPEKTDSLKIREGKDLITLVTCTPKYVNSHRLLVTGNRVPLENTEDIKVNIQNKEIEIKNFLNSIKIFLIFSTIVILVILAIKFI